MISPKNLSRLIFKLYPQVKTTNGDVAYDENGDVVQYDLAAIEAEFESEQTAQQTSLASALSKLKTLGLTDDEISALKGTL